MAEQPSIKVVSNNKKAYHDYFVEDKYECGIELAGTEVKSIRRGNVNLKDSYCIVKDGEITFHELKTEPLPMMIHGMNVAEDGTVWFGSFLGV